MVKNRDHWTIETSHIVKTLTLTGRTGTVQVPLCHAAEHVELGYVQTIHATQRLYEMLMCASDRLFGRSHGMTAVAAGWFAVGLNGVDQGIAVMVEAITDEVTEREPHDGYLVLQGGVPEIEDFTRKVWK